jgi:hypothetical protein
MLFLVEGINFNEFPISAQSRDLTVRVLSKLASAAEITEGKAGIEGSVSELAILPHLR